VGLDRLAGRPEAVPDLDDSVARYADLYPSPRGPRPVDDPGASNQEVEHLCNLRLMSRLSDDTATAAALVRSAQESTPLEPAPDLDRRREILLKREDLGPNGSFKWRGALCACAALQAQGETVVVTASTGNHGAATAWAAARLGLAAHVIVPLEGSEMKTAIIASHGAELHREGVTLDQSTEFGRQLAAELGGAWLEDGASDAQLLGTGTIGAELIEAEARPSVVIAPLACGALAGGLARALAACEPRPWIVGVHAAAFPRLGAVLRGERDPGGSHGVTFADGLADTRIVEPAFSACREHLDQVVSVTDEDLRRAVREIRDKHGILVEGAAAAPLAALRSNPGEMRDGRTVLIISGRNLDPAVAREILA
jgi:threonine dehydratase